MVTRIGTQLVARTSALIVGGTGLMMITKVGDRIGAGCGARFVPLFGGTTDCVDALLNFASGMLAGGLFYQGLAWSVAMVII